MPEAVSSNARNTLGLSSWVQMIDVFKFIFSIIKVICPDYRKIRNTHKHKKEEHNEFIAPVFKENQQDYSGLFLSKQKAELNDIQSPFYTHDLTWSSC
jgi:hypothetical protein